MHARRIIITIVALSGAMLVLAFGLAIYLTRPPAPLVRPNPRLLWNGQTYYWAGVNYPWKTYQDFGTGAWGHGGVSQSTTYAEIDTDFNNMAAQGVKVVKWRVFGDGRYSPDFDAKGNVTGLDDMFFPDIDAAVEIAQKHDMYIVFSLFSSGLWTTNCEKKGVQFGAGPAIVADGGRRSALVNKAVVPLLRHLGKNDRVIAYEIIAEPEWGIKELNQENDYRARVSQSAVRSLVKDVTNAIHKYTPALATVEANRPQNVKYWKGLGLDYYSFSWYDWMAEWDPLDVDIMSYEADRPVVIGEFPVNSQYYDVAQILDIAYNRGLAGAFPWSYTAGDRFSEWSQAQPKYTSWLDAHWPEVSFTPQPGPPPQTNPPVEAQPFGYDRLRLSAFGNSLSVGLDLLVRDGGIYVAKFFLANSDDTPTGMEQEQLTVFSNTNRLPLTVNFGNLNEGQQYQLNLGVFGPSYNLVKWFDGVAVFVLKDGKVELPEPSLADVENPCR